MAAPPPDEDFVARIERRLAAPGAVRRDRSPAIVLWLVPVALGGLCASAVWLASIAGLPLQGIITGIIAGASALLSLPTLLGPAIWIVAAPALILNVLLLASARKGTRT